MIPWPPANLLTALFGERSAPTIHREAKSRKNNTLGQLTGLNNGAQNLTYYYPTGTNNGKITGKGDSVSGETVTYLYDSLNRLASASAGSTWGEAYTYDGFGNLTAKTVTAGSGPSLSVAVDGNNHMIGVGYDANGNQSGYNYDAENRISSILQGQSYLYYCYDAQNRRIFSWDSALDTLNNRNVYTVYYYTPGGQKLGAYQLNIVQTSPSPTLYVTLMTSDRYFGSKRLAPQDRLGSAGDFYPWGEAKGSNNPQDTWSYATYWRDSASGLDYANSRYYSNQYARFMTPDMHIGSAHPSSPQSWNSYPYMLGDPVNGNDPRGEDGSEEDYCAVYAGMDPRACDNGPDCAVFGDISPAFSQFCGAQSQATVVSQIQAITFTPQTRVKIGGSLALNALLNNAACASLFGGDVGSKLSGVPDPYNVLSDILSGTGYANIAYADIPPDGYALGTPPVGKYNIDNATTSPVGPGVGGLYGSALITINTDQYAPFNFGGFISDAVTCLPVRVRTELDFHS